ncbi:transmembrane protein 176B [Sorex fumeus]|uniref:transmembrane protein 176B n=1 Tax=Sorex fumeus TaxID=62283 RepID=UPI0024AD3D9B|nr:transmembrane protein 176B [Sorex fumeus]XP_055962746.1 transmembrane protein 176B [Sorex fumeus]XP_055962747.1 transmembrane protein 176B [Sorex fumeus]
MAQSTVSVTGLDTATTQSMPAHINIHVHQESALAQLVKAGSALKQFFSWPSGNRIGYGQLALGVAQILLGLLSCALGAFLYLGPWTSLRASGCAFWAGALTIAAGAGVIVHEKHPGKCSLFLASLLTVLGVMATVLAVVLCVRSLAGEHGLHTESMCEQPEPEPSFTTTPPWGWHRRRYHADNGKWKVQRCKEFMKMVVNMFIGIQALILAICVLQAIGHGVSLGLVIRSTCARSSLSLDQEELERRLLGQNSAPPSPCKEKIVL